jgi:aconitate hydratase
VNPQALKLVPGDRIEIDANAESLAPRGGVTVRVHRIDGPIETMQATAAVETQLEVELLRDGGVIPSILKKSIQKEPT